jgi:hypothetical protein
MSRAPTAEEIAGVLHEASSLDVRCRGRMEVLRVARPPDLDARALVAAVEEALDGTPNRGVEVMLQDDPGPLRVLGGVFR